MSAPKVQWGAEADRDLLLTIIEDIQISGLKWAQITTKMETKGYSPLGPQSCQQRFFKIRVKASGTASDAGEDGSPEKPKKVSTPRKKKVAPVDGENEVGDATTATPTKRKRASPKKKAKPSEDDEMGGAVKAEVQKQLCVDNVDEAYADADEFTV